MFPKMVLNNNLRGTQKNSCGEKHMTRLVSLLKSKLCIKSSVVQHDLVPVCGGRKCDQLHIHELVVDEHLIIITRPPGSLSGYTIHS